MHLGAIWGICADRELKTGWRKRAIVDIFERRNEMRKELLEQDRSLSAEEKMFIDEEDEDLKFMKDYAKSLAGISKNSKERNVAPNRQVLWLKMIQAWQEEFLGVLSAREFVDTVTGDLLGRRTFVFSRAGQVVNLPYGATVVDYATYRDCLNEMMQVKVNGQVVDFGRKLNNAEVVEVVRGNESAETIKQKVARFRSFLPAAYTKAARYKIEKFLDEHDATFRDRTMENPWEMESYNLIGQKPADGKQMRDDRREVSMFVTSYLRIECTDRSGLLADISAIIANQGMSILSYSGKKDADSDKFLMDFEVTFNESELFRGEALGNLDARLARVCADLLTKVEGVENCSAFCALPDDDMFNFQN
jgi:GTP pyrophosphokinase